MCATCRFSSLVDITAVDYPGRRQSFGRHLSLLVELYRTAASVCGLPGARRRTCVRLRSSISTASGNWFERKSFDMFGIIFCGSPDLVACA